MGSALDRLSSYCSNRSVRIANTRSLHFYSTSHHRLSRIETASSESGEDYSLKVGFCKTATSVFPHPPSFALAMQLKPSWCQPL